MAFRLIRDSNGDEKENWEAGKERVAENGLAPGRGEPVLAKGLGAGRR
jgi:hypothetical protein